MALSTKGMFILLSFIITAHPVQVDLEVLHLAPHRLDNPAIWTLSEPYGAKDWWPVKDTPADKADSADFWITVSTSLTAVPMVN